MRLATPFLLEPIVEFAKDSGRLPLKRPGVYCLLPGFVIVKAAAGARWPRLAGLGTGQECGAREVEKSRLWVVFPNI